MLKTIIYNKYLQHTYGFLGILFIIYLAIILEGNESAIMSLWDKFNHFIAFFVASFYYYLITKNSKIVSIGMVLFGIFLEIAQSFTPKREASFWDIIADIIGIIVAYWVYLLVMKRTKTT